MIKSAKLVLVIAAVAAITTGSYATDTNPPAAVHVVTATAPVNGSDTVQTLTFGAGISGGTFRLKCLGSTTTAITWSATTATLKANIESAMNNMHIIGPLGVVAEADEGFSAGHGDFTLTFSGVRVERFAVPLLTIQTNSLTGVTHTLTAALTTAGVTASGRLLHAGATDVAMNEGTLFVNTHNGPEVSWHQIGGGMDAGALILVDVASLTGDDPYEDELESPHAILAINTTLVAKQFHFADDSTLLAQNVRYTLFTYAGGAAHSLVLGEIGP